MSTLTVLSSDSLCKNDVKNPQGDRLGDIKEIMLDVEHGRIAYAVMSFGGVMGMGDKLFAVPWSALHLDKHDHSFVLDVKKETLKEKDGFDKNDWPDFADPTFNSSTYERYGQRPYWS